ncbi:MAG: 5-formyltetrahydrofolate cyclo-ligase [Kiritimatiellia bacterium]|jgi:5-formyltetrahydrofolate cyclo-ligase
MSRRRQLMGYGAQKRAAYRLSSRLVKTSIYQKSQHIACYWPVNGEIELHSLIKSAWAQGKTCYLPVLNQQQLSFVHYTPTSLMKLNRFGIPEPVTGRVIQPQNLDLVLMPLVVFDKHHHRVGMGGGYYDKTFACASPYRGVYLMGVAHRCQQVRMIRPEPWDVVLDQVLTDE